MHEAKEEEEEEELRTFSRTTMHAIGLAKAQEEKAERGKLSRRSWER